VLIRIIFFSNKFLNVLKEGRVALALAFNEAIKKGDIKVNFYYDKPESCPKLKNIYINFFILSLPVM